MRRRVSLRCRERGEGRTGTCRALDEIVEHGAGEPTIPTVGELVRGRPLVRRAVDSARARVRLPGDTRRPAEHAGSAFPKTAPAANTVQFPRPSSQSGFVESNCVPLPRNGRGPVPHVPSTSERPAKPTRAATRRPGCASACAGSAMVPPMSSATSGNSDGRLRAAPGLRMSGTLVQGVRALTLASPSPRRRCGSGDGNNGGGDGTGGSGGSGGKGR